MSEKNEARENLSDPNWFTPIETPIRFMLCGSKVIGLPPELETAENLRLIEKVNYFDTLTPVEATALLALLYHPRLFAML